MWNRLLIFMGVRPDPRPTVPIFNPDVPRWKLFLIAVVLMATYRVSGWLIDLIF